MKRLGLVLALLGAAALADPAGTPRNRSAPLPAPVDGTAIAPASTTTGYVLTNGAYTGFSGTMGWLISSRSSTTAAIWGAGNAAAPTTTNYMFDQESDGSIYFQSNGSAPLIALGINNSYPWVLSGTTLASSAGTLDSATFRLAAKLLFSSAGAPAIQTGCGTSPSIVVNGSAGFELNVGTGGTASMCGVRFVSAAATRWWCNCNDPAHAADAGFETRTSLENTTDCNFTNVDSTGTPVAWPASTILSCAAIPH